MYIPKYFRLEELMCPHVFDVHKESSWRFLDHKLLETLDIIRENLGQIVVNNWDTDGNYDERGFRCIQCSIVKKKINSNTLYVSAHLLGKAADFDVKGKTAQEVRDWLVKNKDILPYPIRLEKNTNWVHLDVEEGKDKVQLINP